MSDTTHTAPSSGMASIHFEPVNSNAHAADELGKLVHGTIGFSGFLPMLVAADGLCIGVTGTGPRGTSNARRLVACWNACDGVSTQFLEELAGLPESVVASYEAIKAESDTLRAEVERLRAAAIAEPVSAAEIEAAIEATRLALKGGE